MLEAAAPAGAATCFPSLRGAAFSREFLLWRTQKDLSYARSMAMGTSTQPGSTISPQVSQSTPVWGAEDLSAQ